MKLYYYLRYILFAFVYFLVGACKKGSGAICNDGTRSYSTGSGTCSWHGGIHHYVDPNEISVGKTLGLILIIVAGVILIRFFFKKE